LFFIHHTILDEALQIPYRHLQVIYRHLQVIIVNNINSDKKDQSKSDHTEEIKDKLGDEESNIKFENQGYKNDG